MVNLSYAKNWQHRNWNFHSLFSLTHRSNKLVDYYLGVREDEVTEVFSLYKAGSGNEFNFEVGLTYPVNENWVLRSTAQYIKLSSDFSESPLAYDDDGAVFLTSLRYVF